MFTRCDRRKKIFTRHSATNERTTQRETCVALHLRQVSFVRAPPLQLVPPPSSLSLLQHDRGYKHVKETPFQRIRLQRLLLG